MMTTVSNAASSTAGISQSAKAAKTLGGSFDNFLKLLTTQLEKQDPLAPMDATQFTTQLVQFTSVEQAIRTNAQLESLSNLMQANGRTAALGYIGLDVGYEADRFALGTGGGADLGYRLAKDADSVTVTIRDSRGVIVRQVSAPTGAGAHRLAWDGTSATGDRLPAGTYSFNVSALAADGQVVAAAREGRGVVDGLQQTADGISLLVGGIPIPVASVTSVRQPTSAAPALN